MARYRFCSFYLAADQLWKTLHFSGRISHIDRMAMKPKILFCLALVLTGAVLGCTSPANRPGDSLPQVQIQKPIEERAGQPLENVLRKIGRQFPDLAVEGMDTGTASSAGKSPFEMWLGEEWASVRLVLAKNPRPLSGYPGHFIPDLYVTICLYASHDDEQRDVEKSLFGSMRQQTPSSKGQYKEATLYRWSSGGGHVVCQAGLYVVEITPVSEGASPLVMKVLDAVLAELESTSSKSKRP
jgi:hypothetical protein